MMAFCVSMCSFESFLHGGLHDRKKVCSVEGKKTGGFAPQRLAFLRGSWSMGVLSGLEGCAVIAFVLVPHCKDDSYPDVGEGTDGFCVTFPLSSLPLVVIPGPGFLLGRLPGELVQDIAQRFTTGRATVSFGVGPTLKDDRRCASQRLQTAGLLVACPLIPNFCQQSRREPFSRTGQTAENRVVSMRQKKDAIPNVV